MSQEKKLERTEAEDIKHSIAVLEAALYVAGRPLDLKTLGSVVGTRSKRRVQALARSLAEQYSKHEGALELVELDDGRFVLQLKPQHVPKVRRLVKRPLLTSGPLKTLAYVAYRQPVAQSHVIDVRGARSYGHIKELEELGLVSGEKLGKTKILRTTEEFADYFNLSHDLRLMKRQLNSLFESFGKTTKPTKEGD